MNWGSVIVSSVSLNMRFLKSSLLCHMSLASLELRNSHRTSAMYLRDA
jgi:hypothetical protein